MADYAFADPHATATALFCNLLLVGSRGLAATEALNRNGAANSAVLVHQTRGIAHFDWRWRERPALALLAWEPCRDPHTTLRSIGVESTKFNVRKKKRHLERW